MLQGHTIDDVATKTFDITNDIIEMIKDKNIWPTKERDEIEMYFSINTTSVVEDLAKHLFDLNLSNKSTVSVVNDCVAHEVTIFYTEDESNKEVVIKDRGIKSFNITDDIIKMIEDKNIWPANEHKRIEIHFSINTTIIAKHLSGHLASLDLSNKSIIGVTNDIATHKVTIFRDKDGSPLYEHDMW